MRKIVALLDRRAPTTEVELAIDAAYGMTDAAAAA
jgi:hypothetical protein